jgi:hypothetical protein
MKKLIFLSLLFIAGIAYAQKSSKFGFYVGYNGVPTRNVVMMDRLIHEAKYKIIRKELYSQDIVSKYLAVIVCEILQEKERIHLTDAEKNEIILSYKSDRKITYCSGCAFSKETTIKNLLNKNYYIFLNRYHGKSPQDFKRNSVNVSEVVRNRYFNKL